MKTDSSITKFLIIGGRPDFLEKLVNSLIQIKKSPESQEIKQFINELIHYLNAPFIVPEPEYKKKYINELIALQKNAHGDSWVEYQLQTGISTLLNTSLQDVSKFELNYRLLKKMYHILCLYKIEGDRLKNYLTTAIRNRENSSSITTAKQAIFSSTFEQLKKNKIETLLFSMDLDELYLFREPPRYQVSLDIERKNKVHRLTRLMTFLQEIIIDNNFDISIYNQTTVFKNSLAMMIQEVTHEPYNVFQYSEKDNQNITFTLSHRLQFIKIIAFVELDDDSYNLVVSALSKELFNNLESKQYIESIFKPIIMMALDYNLEKLAQLLNDLIIDEDRMLASLIMDCVNQYPNNHVTKLFLLEAFDELRFDYDAEEQEIQNIAEKKLDVTFFEEKKTSFASKQTLSGRSPRSGHTSNKSKSTLSFFNHGLSNEHSSSQQNKRWDHYTHIDNAESDDDIQMFGGTLSRGNKLLRDKSATSPRPNYREDKQQVISPKRSTETDIDYAMRKKARLATNAANASTENLGPIGKITNDFPHFGLSPSVVEKLQPNTEQILHGRGCHYYQYNTLQRAYYSVTNEQQKEAFKNEMDAHIHRDLLSPVIAACHTEHEKNAAFASIKKLSETSCISYGSKLHYMQDMQEVYSNTFDRFNRTLAEAVTFSEYPYEHHPFVSCGDEIIHAARYGFGQKVTGNRFQDRLQPHYYEDGSLENFFLGQLWITLQPWENYYALGKFHIISEYAKGNISIDDRIINERETSFWGMISGNTIAMHIPLIVPSFYGEYPSIYQEAFGINKDQFKNFKNKIMFSFSHRDKKNTQQMTSDIIDHVIRHYNDAILFNIKSALSKKGSRLVYHGLTDQAALSLPSIDAARVLHIYHQHLKTANTPLWIEQQLSHGDYDHHLSRCIRLLVSVSNDGQSIAMNEDTVSQVREYLREKNAESSLLKLLDFVESSENHQKILSLFKSEEEKKLCQIRQLLEAESKSICQLINKPLEFMELFLITVKNSQNADIILGNILKLSKIFQMRFVFLSDSFQALLIHYFEEKIEDARNTLILLASKIEDYNLIEPVNKENQLTTVLLKDIASSSNSIISTQPILTQQENPILQSILAEAIDTTELSGKQQLMVALKNTDYENVKKYIVFANNEKDAEGNTLLHLAVKTGDLNIIREILPKVNSRIEKNNDKLTPVHIACYTGKNNIFDAVYSESITLNATYLVELLKNPASNEENKCALINVMFTKGIEMSANELKVLIAQSTPQVRKLLQHIYELFIGIRDYINQATINNRNPLLHKDISNISCEMKSEKPSSTLIKLVLKRTHVQPTTVLLNLLEQSEACGLTSSAIAMIFTRVKQDIPNRGRINVIIAAILMGDLMLIKKMSHYAINFSLTPNHATTFNNKAVKKPIIFAIQFARQEIFSFILQNSYIDNDEQETLSKIIEQYKTDYHYLLSIFNYNEKLKEKYSQFYQELIICCQEIKVININPSTQSSNNLSITLKNNINTLFSQGSSSSSSSAQANQANSSIIYDIN